MRTMGLIHVVDHVLPDPDAYRRFALAQTFRTYEFGAAVFHGIAPVECPPELLDKVRDKLPTVSPILSFFRQSPAGQREPNYIHSDAEMGDWTGILYLNPDRPRDDGTAFWKHRATGARIGDAWEVDGKHPERWDECGIVAGDYNRLLLFRSPLYHSRVLVDNYGQGDGARLIQVVFFVEGQ
jgi:hypothetical protein